MKRGAGTLFVVPTPIGNLEDLTLRAARVLKECAVIAAEDTRTARHLLDHLGAGKKDLISYFDGNEAARSERLISRILDGEDVALISEAGMPGISDPGQRVIAEAARANVRVEVLPGPCAAVTALVGSAMPTDEFRFVGFLPREDGARQARVGSLRDERGTMIFYEAPSRLAATLADLAAGFGADRPACVARELSKIYEEYVRGTLAELAARYREAAPRGEIVLLVHGATQDASALTVEQIEADIRRRLSEGQSAKEIAAALALVTGRSRRQLYQLVLTLSAR